LGLVIIYLGIVLPQPSCNLPGCQTVRAAPFTLLGLAPGGVCLAGDITATAGGLLHHRFTLTYCWRTNNYHYFRNDLSNMPLCCTIPANHSARPLAGTMLYGVRTFLSQLLDRDHPANLIV